MTASNARGTTSNTRSIFVLFTCGLLWISGRRDPPAGTVCPAPVHSQHAAAVACTAKQDADTADIVREMTDGASGE